MIPNRRYNHLFKDYQFIMGFYEKVKLPYPTPTDWNLGIS